MKKKASKRPVGSIARERLEGRLVGGKFSQLASYSDLFERAKDGIALVDVRNFEILETNGAFRELLERDVSPDGFIFSDLFGDESRDDIHQWLESGTGAREVATPDHRILELEFARVRLADYCEVIQLLVHDVTAERSRRNQLERQSLTDEMTGLANFRAFSTRIALEHERAQIKRTTYCAVFFDVDHFKHFNDRNGHPAGDETLRRIAKILRQISGRGEFVARYGGEEFVSLLPATSIEEGAQYAERVRAAIADANFPFGEFQPLGKVSVSVGVSVSDLSCTPQEVLKSADEALYESKHAGRNRVTVIGRSGRRDEYSTSSRGGRTHSRVRK